MRDDLPPDLKQSLYELEPQALVRLYRIDLRDGSIFNLSPYGDVMWQGVGYDGVPCKMSDLSLDANGKVNRPKFTTVNPQGIFTPRIYEGALDNAWVSRFTILKADFDADRNVFLRERFRVARILSVAEPLLTIELRDILDGHSFLIPANAYLPPDYPHVRLS